MDGEQFELQLWNGKAYETVATGPAPTLQGQFAAGYGNRRIVKSSKQRPAKPRYRYSHGGVGGHSAQWTIGEYMRWALHAGLKTIHVYEGKRPPVAYADITFVTVPVADFLSSAPEAEPDESA
jgi:hypothetical protein